MFKKHVALTLLFSASLYAGGEINNLTQNHNATNQQTQLTQPLSLQAQCLTNILASGNIELFTTHFPDKKQRKLALQGAFIAAITTGNKSAVNCFINQGCSVTEKYKHWTPLMYAAATNQTAVAKLLLKNGAHNDIDDAAIEGLKRGHIATVKLLLHYGVNLTTLCQHYTAMEFAVQNQDITTALPMVQFLLDLGININQQSMSDKSTALHEAVRDNKESYKIVRFLLEHGANPNITNSSGETALRRATSYNYQKTANLLLDYGVKATEDNDTQDLTPLRFAARHGANDLIKRLLIAGADQELKDNLNHPAINEAAHNGHLETVKLLVKAGANVNAKELGFDSPLEEIAVHKNSSSIVELLLEKGATLEYLDYAKLINKVLKRNFLDTACLLLSYKKLNYDALKDTLNKALYKQNLKLVALTCQQLIQIPQGKYFIENLAAAYDSISKNKSIDFFIRTLSTKGFMSAVKEYTMRLIRNRLALTKLLKASNTIQDSNIIHSIVELSLPNELNNILQQYKTRLAHNRAWLTKILKSTKKIEDSNVLNYIVELVLPDELKEVTISPQQLASTRVLVPKADLLPTTCTIS